MRRWLLILVAVVLLAVIAAVGMFYASVRNRMAGPALPACSAPALPRGAFGPQRRLDAPGLPGATHTEVSATLMRDGSVAVAFMANDSLLFDNRLIAGRVPLEGAPELAPLRSDRKKAYDPWIMTGGAGTLHLFWLGHDSGKPERRMQVAWARSDDARTWTTPVDAHAPADCPEDLRGCLDKPIAVPTADGALLLLYYALPAPEGLKAARLEGERRAAASVRIGNAASASAAADRSGTVHVAAVAAGDRAESGYGDPDVRVEYLRSTDHGRTFAAPVRVSQPGVPVPIFFSVPQVVSDEARGAIHVAYASGPSSLDWDVILATSRDGGQSWTYRKVNDDPPCANHALPMAAVDPRTGDVHVAWYENRSGPGGIAHARCPENAARCERNEAVNSVPFASYRLGRHGDDWLGDYASLVLDAERRLLHVVWAQPVDQEGEPRSRVFLATRPL